MSLKYTESISLWNPVANYQRLVSFKRYNWRICYRQWVYACALCLSTDVFSAPGQTDQSWQAISLGEAVSRLESSSGYEIELRPSTARGISVFPVESDGDLDSVLAKLLKHLDYTVFLQEKKHYVVVILGESTIRDSSMVSMPAARPMRFKHSVTQNDVGGLDPNYVEMKGPNGISELVKVGEDDKEQITVEEGWVEQIGPDGMTELVRPARPIDR